MHNITCKNCGGDVTVLNETSSAVTVKCTCCGSVYDHALIKAAPTTSRQNASANPEMAGEDIYDRNIKSVGEISTESGQASGYLISKSGIVVTNTHAVTKNEGAPCTNIRVKVNGKLYKAYLMALGDDKGGSGNGVDLALLFAEGGSFDCVKLGSSKSVRNGEQVYYIGNSQGEGTCITGGIVSDRDRLMGNKHYIMTDAATNPGNSGGPLINKNGEVIGTHVSARMNAVGMKYAIPADTVKAFILEVANRAGLSTRDLSDSDISPSDAGNIGTGLKVFNEGIMAFRRGRRY